jgi:hypothetical protein
MAQLPLDELSTVITRIQGLLPTEEKLYAAVPTVYDEGSAALLQLFAAPAAKLHSHIQASEAPLRMSEGLQASLYSRDVVNRACGVLMERLGVPHEAALQLLIKQAREENAALQQVCERVLAGTPARGI